MAGYGPVLVLIEKLYTAPAARWKMENNKRVQFEIRRCSGEARESQLTFKRVKN